MKWVEVKMRELGVLGNDDYKITCMLDHAAMVTVQVGSCTTGCGRPGSPGRQVEFRVAVGVGAAAAAL